MNLFSRFFGKLFQKEKPIEQVRYTRTPYKAIEVADYIIKFCDSNNIIINNSKLQSLLYLIQIFFLVSNRGNHKPCFKDQIEAWSTGPLIPNVYKEFRICSWLSSIQFTPYRNEYSDKKIYDIEKVSDSKYILKETGYETIKVYYSDFTIAKEDKFLINKVLAYFISWNSYNLRRLISDDIWKKYYKEVSYFSKHPVIPIDEIQKFYSKERSWLKEIDNESS